MAEMLSLSSKNTRRAMPHRRPPAARVARGIGPRAPGSAGFALAPAERDAALGPGLPGEEGRPRATRQEPIMAELRSVDPRSIKPNPNNPRRTPVPPAMDEQLLASIQAIGIIQPPVVREREGDLVVKAGDRRVKAAIKAGLTMIDVIVSDADESHVPMQSLSENLIRASMTSVDIWRATEILESQGWSEQAIADALALPVRTVKRLKLLAHLHPAMLDFMAQGSMPNEDQLRTIAAASRDEQAQVWKKHKPKKGHDVTWYEVARALSKRRIPFARRSSAMTSPSSTASSGTTTCSRR